MYTTYKITTYYIYCKVYLLVMWNKQNRVLKKVNLKRKFEFEDWGFTLTGGWDQGQWIGKQILKN